MDMMYWHISAYLFTPLHNTKAWKDRLRLFLSYFDAKGTILLSQEGINIALSIEPQGLLAFEAFMQTFPEMKDLLLKKTTASKHCFSKMIVKEKPHLIPFSHKSTDNRKTIDANTLDNNYKDYTLLDVRNDYEVRIGTFKGAHHLSIQNFTDLPEKISSLPDNWKKKKTVIFCTGGIRCEKAATLMDELGFEDVYQLEGGIIEYLRNSKEQHWKGDCFTFDYRVSLTPNLAKGEHSLCFACRQPLSQQDMKHADYTPGTSCPYCKDKATSETVTREPLAKA